ncbi:hypothetical protein M409DRAFT_69676 [Zasmidium cellare ATCC 36951]|uniref:Cytochrome P450 n=1 Tax=Zasmidium cellare ATCC 36951 TaxID=1080233 RepID=A0A6A6C3I8_ZASCE|nr:uncharacterized protein M409DRAFT_69676 [Zasmidium cellare ATCC 36951]KAF2161585.1 hypothetical protein M409DRAFT_69676 [Zasmidium cellare ATCC 36951]
MFEQVFLTASTLRLKTILVSIPLLAATSLLAWIFYTLFLHPLAKYPGPRLAAITRLWYVRQLQRGKFPTQSRELHKTYGPIVRIAPDEVSFSDPKAGLAIYNVKTKFPKDKFQTDFYSTWSLKNFDTNEEKIFSDVDEVHAANRRKLLLPSYSMSSVLEAETSIDQYTELLLKRFNELGERDEELNLVWWLEMYALDVIGDLFYGRSFGHLEAGGDAHGWLASIETFLIFITIHASSPPYLRPLHDLWQALTNKAFRGSLGTTVGIRDTSIKRAEERQTIIDEGKSAPRKDLLAKFMDLQKEKQRSDWQLPDIQQEGFVALFADSDTTAIAMSSMLHGIMANADVMSKVLKELREALSDGTITLPVRYSDSIKLPYMSACIKEGFRLHTSTGVTMSRFVPPGGAEIAGERFPAGTRVGCNSHVTHFDKETFGPDAVEFVPERWLKGDAASMERHMLHFGGGTRTCIGKHVALAEIHKLLPHLLLEFDLQLVDPKAPIISDGQWFDKPLNIIVKARRRIPEQA